MEIDMRESNVERMLRVRAEKDAAALAKREAAEQAASGLPAPTAPQSTVAPDCPIIAENITGRQT